MILRSSYNKSLRLPGFVTRYQTPPLMVCQTVPWPAGTASHIAGKSGTLSDVRRSTPHRIQKVTAITVLLNLYISSIWYYFIFIGLIFYIIDYPLCMDTEDLKEVSMVDSQKTISVACASTPGLIWAVLVFLSSLPAFIHLLHIMGSIILQ